MQAANALRRVTLQRLVALAVLLVLVPVVLVQAGFSYRTAQESSARFQEQLASGVSAQVFDKVLEFFLVPSRVVHFNAEQFRAGALNAADLADVQRNFLLQLGQQPLLTFVSMGNARGEYYAASRPPRGGDQALRLLEATEAGGRRMALYRVDAGHVRGALVAHGNTHFDARERPWFRAAVGFNSPRWYPAYRYAINDPDAAFDALGIGMSAPLYDRGGSFVGVVTADVALLQLSQLLADITRDLGGTAFLYDDGGHLLATSTAERLYELKGDKDVRTKAVDSGNALIREASRVIAASHQPEGRTVRQVGGQSYLLDWRQHALPDGPVITIANMLPQSQFDAPARGLAVNLLLFSTGLLLLGLVLSFVVGRWLARPLVALGEWAAGLGRGDWQQQRPAASPIKEVEALSGALQGMADNLKYHADHLQQEVAARTAELERANTELARLSNTDGLTGLANRRYFDDILAQELARARRHGHPLALVMVDVDDFKPYNDHYGHLAGDHCLVQVAAVLKAHVQRPSDLAARYGGEEFAVIAAHCDLEAALALAEILRARIAGLGLPHAASPRGHVSVSLGVAVMQAEEGEDGGDARELIRRADKALYLAKRQGRDRVACEPPLT